MASLRRPSGQPPRPRSCRPRRGSGQRRPRPSRNRRRAARACGRRYRSGLAGSGSWPRSGPRSARSRSW